MVLKSLKYFGQDEIVYYDGCIPKRRIQPVRPCRFVAVEVVDPDVTSVPRGQVLLFAIPVTTTSRAKSKT